MRKKVNVTPPPEISSSVTSSKRIGYIDALKGFAILCVVMGHVADGNLTANSQPDYRWFSYTVFNVIYAFHMPLFMMISGFVFRSAYGKSGAIDSDKVKKQVYNLIVIYFFFSVAYGIVKLLLANFTNHSTDIKSILMIPVLAIAPYWYLYVLIGLYLVFSWKKFDSLNCYMVLFLLTVMSIVSGLWTIRYFEISRILYYSLFFYIGMLHRTKKDIIIGNKLLSLILLIAAITLFVFFWNSENNIENTIDKIFLVNFITALGISLTIWYLFENIKFLSKNRFLQFLGRYSLEIYVIHCIFTAGIRVILQKLGIENVYICFVLNTVVSTAIPIMISVICKKLNIHGLFFKPVTYIRNLRREK